MSNNDFVIKVCLNRSELLRLLDIEKKYEKLIKEHDKIKKEHEKCIHYKNNVLHSDGGGEIETSGVDTCRILPPNPGIEDPNLLNQPVENSKLPVQVVNEKDIDYQLPSSSHSTHQSKISNQKEAHGIDDNLLIHGVWDRFKPR